MKEEQTIESQWRTLLNHLLLGLTIDRVQAFRHYGIADLRSRVSDCERFIGVHLDRQTVKGKRYLEYSFPKFKSI